MHLPVILLPALKPRLPGRSCGIASALTDSCRTTFIQNLLGPYAQQPDLAVNGVAGPEALKTFQDAPEKMATVVEVQDNNSLTHFHYSVQDSPGETHASLQQPICSWCISRYTPARLCFVNILRLTLCTEELLIVYWKSSLLCGTE